MITYELLILFRALPKVELKPVIKRTAESIYNKGGVLRKLENLGTRETPYKISSHGLVHKQASYFMYEFNVPLTSVKDLLDEMNRDVDVVRRRIYKKVEPQTLECTLDDELKPAAYRPEVIKLMEESKKVDKKKKKFNFGLKYYPFQR